MFLRKAHDRSEESNWGAVIMVKKFSLERENNMHLNFQSLSQGWTSELGSCLHSLMRGHWLETLPETPPLKTFSFGLHVQNPFIKDSPVLVILTHKTYQPDSPHYLGPAVTGFTCMVDKVKEGLGSFKA